MPSVTLLLSDSGGVPEKKSSRVDNLLDKIGDDRLTCAEKGQASTKLQIEEATSETEA
jgi:hypothetical protein